MASEEIHVNDIGNTFTITLKDGTAVVDISTATTKSIIFGKPDGTTLTKTAGFVTDGSDGKINYSSVSGDLNIPGIWSIQAHVVLSSGNWKTDIAHFDVHDNI
jgi:hypothetical protein